MNDLCDSCWYNSYDEESGEGYCALTLDEDEVARLINSPIKNKTCKYFRPDNGEYEIVRKQN